MARSAPAPYWVDEAEFSALLERAAAMGDARAGLFGPDSISWAWLKESAVFLGAGRAALMQLGHPWVAQAIHDHSRTLTQPLHRFQATFRAVYAMVFGDLESALAAARRVRAVHDRISGDLPEALGGYEAGSPYRANEANALGWVQATLTDTVFELRSLMFEPPSAAERAAFLDEQRRFGWLFGVPDGFQLTDPPAFSAMLDRAVTSGPIEPGRAARTVAEGLMAGVRLGPLRIAPSWYRRLTIHLLPAPLREGFGFAAPDDEAASLERRIATVRAAYRRLPAAVRHAGPYQAAEARLAGRSPGAAARLSTRLLTGG